MTVKKIIRSEVNPLNFPTLFFAGRARLTLRNQKMGTHMTLHVKQLRDKKLKDAKGRRVKLPIFYLYISLLGDHDHGYNFAGTIFKDNMGVKLGAGIGWGTQMGKVTAFLMQALKDPEILRKRNVGVFHEGKCCRCGMPLTHPESISRALGDDCYAYTQKEKETESPL